MTVCYEMDTRIPLYISNGIPKVLVQTQVSFSPPLFVYLATHRRHLCLRLEDEHEMIHQNVTFHFLIFIFRCVIQFLLKNKASAAIKILEHVTDRGFSLPRCALLKQWITLNVYNRFQLSVLLVKTAFVVKTLWSSESAKRENGSEPLNKHWA